MPEVDPQGTTMTTHHPDASPIAADQPHRAQADDRICRSRTGPRRQAYRQVPAPHDREAEEILRFARIWAPYGGAPDDETFQRFGMSRPRFFDKLWESVRDSGCGQHLESQLAIAYPRPTFRTVSQHEPTNTTSDYERPLRVPNPDPQDGSD